MTTLSRKSITLMSVAAAAATGSFLFFFYHYYQEESQEDMEKKTKNMKPIDEQDENQLEQQETVTSLSFQQHKPTEIIVYHPLNYCKFSSGDMLKTLVVACRDVACNHMTEIKRQRQFSDVSVAVCDQGGQDSCSTSTQCVLKAIATNHCSIHDNTHVSADHFDIDSFLAVWCCVYPGK